MNEGYRHKLPRKEFALLRELIIDLVKNRKPLNIGLYLSKYVDWSGEKAEIRKQIQVFSGGRLGIPSSAFPLNEYEDYFMRFTRSLEALRSQGHSVEVFDAELVWRLAVNLGSESVYETSISLHRNYSIPVIPGSAVKGVARAWASLEKADGRFTDAELEDIFGNRKQEGKVVFFDAMPSPNIDDNFVVLDIMNAHYGDYYQGKGGKTVPGDWMDPVPIFFLAVEKVPYRFSLASEVDELANKASQILKEAISENGVGAKTSSGYGYFVSSKK